MTKTNEISIKVLSPDEKARLGGAATEVRSDDIPKPNNVFCGQMTMLQKPEAIKKKPSRNRK